MPTEEQAEDLLLKLQTELQSAIGDFQPTSKATENPKVPARQFKWSTSLDAPRSQLPTGARSLPSLNETWLWESDHLQSLIKSASGAQGAFFVVYKTAQVLVLKPPVHSLRSELVASLVAQFFHVYTPKCRLIRTDSEEGRAMLTGLKTVDPLWQVLTCLYDQRYVMVKEFVPGCGWSRTAKTFPEISDIEPSVLHEMGRLTAIDVLLNNSDRLPLICNNQGNSENLYIAKNQAGMLQIINVDPTASPISNIQEQNNFFQNVKSFIKRVQDAPDHCPEEFISIVSRLEMWNADIRLPKDAALLLSKGFMSILELFQNPTEYKKFQDFLQDPRLEAALPNDTDGSVSTKDLLKFISNTALQFHQLS